jgi:predicted RNase H-like HicB family nuclease
MIKAPDSIMVKAEFDDDAKVWVATSDDVPGLVSEHKDLMKLLDEVGELIPILLEENGLLPPAHEAFDMPVCLAAQGVAKRRVLIPA